MKTKLNYQAAAEGRPWRWRRWVFAVVMTGLGVTALRVAPGVARRLVIVKLQDECLRDVPPPGQPVFDMRPDSLPARRRSDPKLVSGTVGSAAYVAWLPPEWSQFLARSGAPATNAIGLIGVRRMRTISGDQRIVCLEIVPEGNAQFLPISISARVFLPATPLGKPAEVTRDTVIYNYRWMDRFGPSLGMKPPVAILADSPNPATPDRATFHIVNDSESFIWEARLERDTVTLALLSHSPLTPPPPASQASSR